MPFLSSHLLLPPLTVAPLTVAARHPERALSPSAPPPPPSTQLGMQEKLPPEVPERFAQNEAFLKALHHVLLEVEIIEGQLICPETGKKFPIKEGIPSML